MQHGQFQGVNTVPSTIAPTATREVMVADMWDVSERSLSDEVVGLQQKRHRPRKKISEGKEEKRTIVRKIADMQAL